MYPFWNHSVESDRWSFGHVQVGSHSQWTQEFTSMPCGLNAFRFGQNHTKMVHIQQNSTVNVFTRDSEMIFSPCVFVVMFVCTM